jgi:L-ascorbate metabolism protein UlaG (beta-lactamase superfamily)
MHRLVVAVVVVLAMLFSACAGGTSGSPAASPAVSAVVPSVAPVATPPVTPVTSVVPSTAAVPSTAPNPPARPGIPAEGVTIINEATSQFELWSPQGQRILVDIANPQYLTSPATSADVLLTTHYHEDHYSFDFVKAFPGRALTVEEGTLTAGDVSIRSIAAAHNQGDPITTKGATDYIFVIDVGGIRVVVFGDLGQDALTARQMQGIGKADVAISQLENEVSDVTAVNRKAIAQMNQVKPALLIPTHIDTIAAAKMAAAAWPALTATYSWVTITRSKLPTATTVLFLGDLAPSYRKLLGITTPSW